jgi:hypothetical protein
MITLDTFTDGRPMTPAESLAFIRDILWRDGSGTEWSADTLAEVADILTDAGYGPEGGAA